MPRNWNERKKRILQYFFHREQCVMRRRNESRKMELASSLHQILNREYSLGQREHRNNRKKAYTSLRNNKQMEKTGKQTRVKRGNAKSENVVEKK